jgi:hypothetical protein
MVVLGTLLRLRRYLQNRGLMHDDAQLASNIFSKSFGQLFRPLNIGDQAAPVGFLILQKCSTVLFGHGELAIRLVPFLAAVLVLPIFFMTVRRAMSPSIALVTTAFLVLAEPLVRYCAEGKQYSTDVLWTTLAMALSLRADSIAGVALLTVAGAVLLWFSHPLLFVLGGIGLTLLVMHARDRKYALVRADIVMGAAWLASFAVNYLLVSRYYVSNDFLRTYWQRLGAFAPLPDSLRSLLWYPQTLLGLFSYPLGIVPSDRSRGAADFISCVAGILFLIGCVVIAWRWKRAMGFIVLTLILTLVASALQRYPFSERLTLFCAPLVVLPLGAALGIGWWQRCTSQILLWLAICAILFIYPVYIQAKYALHPEVRYDAKPAIDYVKAHWRPGDWLYLHWGSDVLGTYYLRADPPLTIAPGHLIDGVFDSDPKTRADRYAADLLPLDGHKRVWVVFSMDPSKDRLLFEKILGARGRLVDHERFNGSTADLYDLR